MEESSDTSELQLNIYDESVLSLVNPLEGSPVSDLNFHSGERYVYTEDRIDVQDLVEGEVDSNDLLESLEDQSPFRVLTRTIENEAQLSSSNGGVSISENRNLINLNINDRRVETSNTVRRSRPFAPFSYRLLRLERQTHRENSFASYLREEFGIDLGDRHAESVQNSNNPLLVNVESSVRRSETFRTSGNRGAVGINTANRRSRTVHTCRNRDVARTDSRGRRSDRVHTPNSRGSVINTGRRTRRSAHNPNHRSLSNGDTDNRSRLTVQTSQNRGLVNADTAQRRSHRSRRSRNRSELNIFGSNRNVFGIYSEESNEVTELFNSQQVRNTRSTRNRRVQTSNTEGVGTDSISRTSVSVQTDSETVNQAGTENVRNDARCTECLARIRRPAEAISPVQGWPTIPEHSPQDQDVNQPIDRTNNIVLLSAGFSLLDRRE